MLNAIPYVYLSRQLPHNAGEPASFHRSRRTRLRARLSRPRFFPRPTEIPRPTPPARPAADG
jgi:hypothetical protein